MPAAFGRLCVETLYGCVSHDVMAPAAFGRLCVETLPRANKSAASSPAAFGRLCVETVPNMAACMMLAPSRLRAAVC